MSFVYDQKVVDSMYGSHVVSMAVDYGVDLVKMWPLQTNQELENDVKYAENLQVMFSGMMTQVLLNLFLNAVQAMPDGGMLRVRGRAEGTELVLEVADTGCGIASERLADIFSPYFTTKGQGTGLGLATVHKIIEAHGGSISVTSEPGQGAVFRILLPVGEAGQQGAAEKGRPSR